MLKKALSFIGILLIVGVLWYLFLKPSDYRVSFNVATTAGTINQSIKSWNAQLDGGILETSEDISVIKQQLKFGDSIHNYTWSFSALNDSMQRIHMDVKDPDNSLANKLAIPFSETVIKKRAKQQAKAFYDILTNHLKRIKVTVEGESTVPSQYCAYIPLKGLQIEKARGMMQNYTLLSEVLLKNQVELSGTPFVEVTKWNPIQDSIEYNFCFPIKRSDKLPIIKNIKYKRIFEQPAIKAIYNGNYITSDRAWYALLEYAERNNIAVEKTPIEIFYNNPNMGGDELIWKAEVFMPLKQ
jgi:effector-binding domain-containing protein